MENEFYESTVVATGVTSPGDKVESRSRVNRVTRTAPKPLLKLCAR